MKLDRKRIARLLAEGTTPIVVSQEVGISPSHLSQLMSEENFALLVEEFKAVVSLGESLEEYNAREQLHNEMDNYWDEVEALSIDALKTSLAGGLVTKTHELLAIANVANRATRKKHGTQRMRPESSGANIVQLNISNVLLQRGAVEVTTRNSDNQVIEVGGRTIVNATKESIFQRLEGIKDEKAKLAAPSIKEVAELTIEDL